MRNDEEIVNRIEELRPGDFLGFDTQDLIYSLPFESARPYLNSTVTEAEWEQGPRSEEEIKARMLDYMPFAWEKANGFRGISASRSMSHYTAWLWLIDVDLGNLMDYQYYGKDELVKICDHFGWDHSQWDDGVRANSEE